MPKAGPVFLHVIFPAITDIREYAKAIKLGATISPLSNSRPFTCVKIREIGDIVEYLTIIP